MPKNWGRLASIQTVPHEPFDLEDGGLYDPANNSSHQRGSIRGFLVRDGVL
jgi:hypothetical protein